MNNPIFKFINIRSVVTLTLSSLFFQSCIPTKTVRDEKKDLPEQFQNVASKDTTNSAQIKWKTFFNDANLAALIDTALVNNQELNIMLQKVDMAKNEIQARKGEYLPFVGIQAAAEVEKVGRYTSQGANDANTEIKPGKEFPEPLQNYKVGAFASWELDVWKKLRNAKKAAVMEYLSTVEGKNFMVTSLIAEIADSYYELQALDNKLAILTKNLELQNNGLTIIRLQMQAAKATALGVQRLEAEVYKNTGELYNVKQDIVETENRLNFLIGRTPQHINRDSDHFIEQNIDPIYAGIPSQLLTNRPDIRQAEYELQAAKLDTKVARANFYPSFTLKAGVGLESFKTQYLTTMPESLIYGLAGDMVAPLINRNAIKAAYYNANDKQLQAVFDYEKTILNAHIEVLNGLSKIENLKKSYEQKEHQVAALTNSIEITNKLFSAARADYMEVLLTQRDALESKLQLVETKKEQLTTKVNMYKSLGGGWN
ncbi:efflux transporter, outer membrane factor (OMF) lipoprotein, NodT family [Flavobacterium glycines]|uniref:Efflux transporter, outer membrane factor (OMF) lipoprotein, NodT family n=1 Tax=Flavobacterium glycines TaxID=551990 RepID=A0A1B9DP18_9FLAO|nr:TolC family protein [Flavobacterium glycines]OCB71437.1 RND transporter [Flavobacterium glycines]GEL10458.1 RND transporter [Flavobacterium glycines]SDI67276.1 efflux transporter, outer membrane factor (OMF) lipoprotein, NodT family [Flavobacterium glycines]